VRQPERVADGHHRLRHIHRLRVPELEGRQVIRHGPHLQHREVGVRIRAGQLGLEHPRVTERNPDLATLGGGRHDMVVGQHVAGVVDDHTGSHAPAFLTLYCDADHAGLHLLRDL
jgi:hypothetical protein